MAEGAAGDAKCAAKPAERPSVASDESATRFLNITMARVETKIVPQVDAAQLSAELESLAAFSDSPAPAVTRIVFSETDRRAHHYVKDLCVSAGLIVREDAVGNTFARWIGTEPSLPAIGTGSHIDAIPNAGRYDGTVGVLGGLEAIRALQRSGFHPRRSIELVLFTSEEPTRFGIGCLGSRLLGGLLDASVGEQLKDKNGTS